jgi:hypothetical protein
VADFGWLVNHVKKLLISSCLQNLCLLDFGFGGYEGLQGYSPPPPRHWVRPCIDRLCKYFPVLLLEPLYYRGLTSSSDIKLRGQTHGHHTVKILGCVMAISVCLRTWRAVSRTKRATLVRAFFRCGRRRQNCGCTVFPAAGVVLLPKESVGWFVSGMPTTATRGLFLTVINLSVRTIPDRPIGLAQP